MSVAEISRPVAVAPAPSQASATAPRVRLGWIVNARTDLPWFIGGALGGYALFAMHAALAWDMATVWLVWYVLLDIPHFFGTYVRTYLDREELGRRPTLLFGSLGFLGAGPLVLLLCLGMLGSGSATLRQYHLLPYQLMLLFVSLWAYWHVVRQHYGIMALYKRKNHDHGRADGLIDRTLLYGGLWAPLVAMAVRHPDARWYLGLSASPAEGGWESVVVALTIVFVAMAAAIFLARQAQLWLRGEPVNLPKILFLAAVVPLHVFVCYHPAVFTASLLAFSAFVTIFHDLQYHAIVWHTQRNRLRQAGSDTRRLGLARWVSKHFLIYITCAVAWGVGAWFVGCSLGVEPGCGPILPSASIPLFGAVTLYDLFLCLAVGFIMHHYFVDQFIWRPSKDTRLRQELQVAQP